MWRFKDKLRCCSPPRAQRWLLPMPSMRSMWNSVSNMSPKTNVRPVIIPVLSCQTFYGHHVSLNFKTPLAVSGVAGTAPVTSPLWLACGFAQVSDATKVVYSRGAATPAVASFIFGKHTHAITGLKGNFSLALEKGRPMIQWQFKGVFRRLQQAAQPCNPTGIAGKSRTSWGQNTAAALSSITSP